MRASVSRKTSPFSAAAGAARKAVALPKVRSSKSAILDGGILHLPGNSVTLLALYYTLPCKYCEEISRKDEQVTSRLDQGWSAPRSQPPRTTSAELYRRAFHVPSRRLRFEGTFHVFAKVLAKTFHFCAAVYVRLPLTYICAKISRPEQGRILSLIVHCALAQDINGCAGE